MKFHTFGWRATESNVNNSHHVISYRNMQKHLKSAPLTTELDWRFHMVSPYYQSLSQLWSSSNLQRWIEEKHKPWGIPRIRMQNMKPPLPWSNLNSLLGNSSAKMTLVNLLKFRPNFCWNCHFISCCFFSIQIWHDNETKPRMFYLSSWVPSCYLIYLLPT